MSQRITKEIYNNIINVPLLDKMEMSDISYWQIYYTIRGELTYSICDQIKNRIRKDIR